MQEIPNQQNSTPPPPKTTANLSKSSPPLEGLGVGNTVQSRNIIQNELSSTVEVKTPPLKACPPIGGGGAKAAGMQGDVKLARYSFTEVLSYLETTGKAFFGDHFKIHSQDHPTIEKLLVYFFADKKRAEELNINLKKGVMLTGPVGCGKTTLMTLMRFFLHPRDQYIMKPCRDVTFEFVEEGFQILNKYSKASFHTIEGELYSKAYCFDDLGLENNLRHFGNECNIMAEILFSRYDLFISKGMQTHITTNLNSSEIEGIYNIRLRSRLREMMNLISFEKNSIDKRT
jgi:energy-coupling factor transporter ATP-binding protein EcfA2